MQYEMIGTEPKIAIILMIICGILLPTAVATVWKIKTKEPISTILIGAVIFAVFAIGLESIPKAFLFQLDNPVSAFVILNSCVLCCKKPEKEMDVPTHDFTAHIPGYFCRSLPSGVHYKYCNL
jgi:Na+-transporting NADH:ubiquinone oxidoreductase subunit NqrD